MVQSIIKLGDREDRILNIVKGKFGFKNKSDAINFVIDKFEEELLEPQLRTDYVNKILSLKKSEKFEEFNDLDSLRKEIENV